MGYYAEEGQLINVPFVVSPSQARLEHTAVKQGLRTIQIRNVNTMFASFVKKMSQSSWADPNDVFLYNHSQYGYVLLHSDERVSNDGDGRNSLTRMAIFRKSKCL